jgi:hypothetical protein
LGHIRSVDAILQVVRCFENPDITHVDGTVNPIRDIETIEIELALADLQSVEKRIDKLRKQAKTGDKEIKGQLDLTERVYAALSDGKAARTVEITEGEATWLRDMQLLTAKPLLYVCNVDEAGLMAENDHVLAVRTRAASEGAAVVVICAQIESELSEMAPDDKMAFLADYGLKEPGLASLARATYDLLGLQTYFTAGPKEVRAWTIKRGTKAPQAAGVIHSDFERGFIRAEVYTIPDLLEHKTEAGLKSAGKMRLEGKEYVVQDGDVMHFRFNV